MKNQSEIEHEWDVAKLLITDMNYKMLLFHVPQYGLYIDKISPIYMTYPRNRLGLHIFGSAKQPHIVTVRSKNIARVTEFIQKHPEFQAYRIFKHGLNFRGINKINAIGIICETTKNMLHLYPGKTFYITSKNKKLGKLFYEKAVQINEEDELGCSFDYDEYDYTLDIRTYKLFKERGYVEDDGRIKYEKIFNRWAIITILYGKGLPNTWNIETRQKVIKCQE